ncbi:14538_t:CDS:2, partial [Dentiscutata heterogama]
NKKTNLQVIESAIQVASNDKLEILSQINKNTKKYNSPNKENIISSKNNEEYFTASNFIKLTSGNNITTFANHESSDSTSNIESDTMSS